MRNIIKNKQVQNFKPLKWVLRVWAI